MSADIPIVYVPPHGPGREAGFTLLELLVALVLLALAMVIIPSTLRLASRAVTTSAELVEQTGDHAAMSFIEQTVAQAMPLFERDQDGNLQIAFKGERSGLSFVAPLTGGPAGGGLYLMRLQSAVNELTGLQSLDLNLAPFVASHGEEAEPPLPEQRRILGRLASAEFRYFGIAEGQSTPGWQQTWSRKDRLPDLVELTYVDSRGGGDNLTTLRIEPQLRPRR